MAKHSLAVRTQPGHERGHEPAPASVAVRAREFSRNGEPPVGLVGADHHESVMVQAGRLSDTRLQTAQQRALASQIGETYGNLHLQRVVLETNNNQGMTGTSGPVVQRQPKNPGKGSGGGGSGPGRIQNASERYYDVDGSTLDEVGPQLQRFDGFAAETNAPITIRNRVRPQRQEDGTYQIRVEWVIRGAFTRLPRWTNYGNTCPAAKQEWDRYMTQTRAHEQQAHVDAALAFVSSLGEEDVLVTGASVAEVSSNLQAKHQELAARLQAIHDSCTHGADIDAILHLENGVCE